MRKFSELSEKEKIEIRIMIESPLVLTCYFSLLISDILSIIVPFNKVGITITTIWFIINIIACLVADNDEIPIFLKILDLISSGFLAYHLFTSC